MTSACPNTSPWKRLYLCEDPSLIHRQMQGEALLLSEIAALRDDISTDEITPVAILSYYDERLGEFAHTGLSCSGELPIKRGLIKAQGIKVLIAGNRYGKGSSREHSPSAEKHAGIKLIVARSFERIYRQNADNIGLFTSTDFGLIERLERGEIPSDDELVAGREPLAAAIVLAGGILHWARRHLGPTPAISGSVSQLHEGRASDTAKVPMSLFEKILSRHMLATPYTSPSPQYGEGILDRKSTRLNSSHRNTSRMPSSA